MKRLAIVLCVFLCSCVSTSVEKVSTFYQADGVTKTREDKCKFVGGTLSKEAQSVDAKFCDMEINATGTKTDSAIAQGIVEAFLKYYGK